MAAPVSGLRKFVRSVLDPAARNWLAEQDAALGGPKRLSRGLDLPRAKPARQNVRAATTPVIATS